MPFSAVAREVLVLRWEQSISPFFIRNHRGGYQVVKWAVHLRVKLHLWPEANFAQESLG